MLLDLRTSLKFGCSTLHFLKLTFSLKLSHQFHHMWNSFEVLFKQRFKLLLHAVKMLPMLVRYLFILICVSSVADNPVTE